MNNWYDFDEIASNYTIEEIENKISRALKKVNYSRYFFPYIKLEGFFRARLHENENEFNFIHEFWSRPNEQVKNYGRCNDKNQSILYCSAHRVISILEVKPKKQQYVSVISVIIDPNFLLKISPIVITRLKEINSSNKNFAALDKILIKSDNPIYSVDVHLEKLFCVDVKNNEDFYKCSIAVSNIIFKNVVTEERKPSEIDGILYPSMIKTLDDGFNFALKPKNLFERVEVEHIVTYKVLDSNYNFIELKPVRIGFPKEKNKLNSEISWQDFDSRTEKHFFKIISL